MSRVSRCCIPIVIYLLLPIQTTAQRTGRGYVPPGMTETQVAALQDSIVSLAREKGRVPDHAPDHLVRFEVTIASPDIGVASGYWWWETYGLVEGSMVFGRTANEWKMLSMWSSPLMHIAPAPEGVPADRVGVLRLWVYPSASVTIDDERLVVADRTLASLSAGSHTIRLRADGYEVFETDVTVVAGDTVTVMHPMVRQR